MKLFRRRTFILNTRFQASLLFISLGYALFGTAILGAALFTPVIVSMETSGYTSEEAVRAADLLLYLHGTFWTAWTLSLCIIALHSIRTSHRIAGPLWRMNQVIRSLKSGLVSKPLRQPRQGDYFVDEIVLTNQMLESLRARLGEIRKAEGLLGAAISQCREISPEATKEQLLLCLEAVAEKERLLVSELDAFTVED
jgi:hypothetical protein